MTRIFLYDSTLRDGAQTAGIDFTATDKQDISTVLDQFGIDYIEAGWPGANPTDDAFFAMPPKLLNAKLTAFGMTRRAKTSVANDPGLAALINVGVNSLCIVGKAWDIQVKTALAIDLPTNIAMIGESIAHIRKHEKEVTFDAEHFFDGYKSNPEFAIQCLKAAYDNGARWMVLCDTNGGTLPFEIEEIVTHVTKVIPGDHLAIHCHNDTGNAIANSLAAVRAGARQIQGTINGVGERCGNTNLISIIPTLMLKMGFETGITDLKNLTHVSSFVNDRLNRSDDPFTPYVGSAAFAHKGGLHAAAVNKSTASYEHIDPSLVGNDRAILVSNQAGRSNIISRLQELGIDLKDAPDDMVEQLVATIKQRENEGYAYDNADASFELLARRLLGEVPKYYTLLSFRVIDEQHENKDGERKVISEATTKIQIEDEVLMTVANGNGPVNALDIALRKALSTNYPILNEVKLIDYKVRILGGKSGTKALTRVMIESEDNQQNRWTTIGVSTNIIGASYNALRDSITYKLMQHD